MVRHQSCIQCTKDWIYIDMAALEVAGVILWLKKFDFWTEWVFKCAWLWESPRDPSDVIAETQ